VELGGYPGAERPDLGVPFGLKGLDEGTQVLLAQAEPPIYLLEHLAGGAFWRRGHGAIRFFDDPQGI